MTDEHKLMNEIRIAVSPYCKIFRINVGTGFTHDGRYFDTGVPKGFSDLFGVRISDGKAVFIEVKTKKGRPSGYQTNFIKVMQKSNAIAGICRSVDDALKLIRE